MSDRQPEAGRSISQAHEAQRAVQDAGRWFAGYLVLVGTVCTVQIVALETAFHDGAARVLPTTAGALALGGLWWWADSRDVHPRGSRRSMLVAFAVWYGTWLLLVGPLVRWRVGTSLGWWTLASVLLASPFFVAAWRYRRTS